MLEVDNARIYYEANGNGQPVVFIHAGVADSRQWNGEFQHFSSSHFVIRYDMRGFGKSHPVAGEYTDSGDLLALFEQLNINQPAILVGCSMGGSTALDFALDHPGRVKALVLVGSAPSGINIDLPTPDKFALVEEAEKAGDLELVAELETQIWFDGDRPTESVNQQMRELAYNMNLTAIQNAAKELGTRKPNTARPAIDRLDELNIPLLAILGASDLPYMHAATEVLAAKIADFRQVVIDDAAHLPNMDQPQPFQKHLEQFFTT